MDAGKIVPSTPAILVLFAFAIVSGGFIHEFWHSFLCLIAGGTVDIHLESSECMLPQPNGILSTASSFAGVASGIVLFVFMKKAGETLKAPLHFQIAIIPAVFFQLFNGLHEGASWLTSKHDAYMALSRDPVFIYGIFLITLVLSYAVIRMKHPEGICCELEEERKKIRLLPKKT